MAKRYLLLAALSALMLGACSDDNSVNGEPDVPQMQPNTLPMNVLSASSQAGRITVASATRGLKSERLQRVATIAPVTDVGGHNWSATAVTVRGDNAYVTWHSDHQATTQAEVWGGAIDVINIPSEAAGQWRFSRTATNGELKFNHVYTDGTNLYLAATIAKKDAKVGAAVCRVAMDNFSTVDYLNIPGSSANAVAASGTDLVAVSGYKGAAVSFPAAFDATTVPTVLQAEANDFGGKYVEDGYILRTDDANAQLIQIGGSATTLDVALVSAPKAAESYDPNTGKWETDGETATHFGKHTMAINGGYVYIAAGMNGLRSYALGSSNAVWENGTYTTAVCADEKYVYAATDAGLRVYEKKDNGELELFAFEVKEYDAAGKPTVSTAGSDGHSANFVALGGGYIFVAYGQSGVYVFKLNENAEPTPEEKDNLSLRIPAIEHNESKEVDKGSSAEFTIPETIPDAPEGKEFAGWSENPDDENSTVYQPGGKVTVTPENPNVELKPVWKDKTPEEKEFTLTFNINGGTGETPPSVTKKSTESTCTIENLPGADNFSKEGYDFLGWSTDRGATEAEYSPAESITISGNVTLYAVWTTAEVSYTVTFDKENATGEAPEPQTITGKPNEELKITLPEKGNLERENRDFQGWSTLKGSEQNADMKVYKPGEEFVLTGDVTFYPVWTVKQTTGEDPDAPNWN